MRQIATAILAALSMFWALPADAERIERAISVHNAARSYIVHLPKAGADPEKRHVIFALHPGFGTAKGFETQLNLHNAAGADAFIIVYPNGIGRSWNAGGCCGPALSQNIDDVAFMNAILSDLAQLTPLHPSGHLATGFSNGGAMALRMGCDMGAVIRAVVVMGGTKDHSLGCERTAPLSVMFLHGAMDGFSPIAGGMGALSRPGPAPILGQQHRILAFGEPMQSACDIQKIRGYRVPG